MTTGYAAVVVLGILAVAFGVLSLAVSSLLRPRHPLPAKVAPYESGIEPVRLPRRGQFPVKFYVIAMLFIIFDVETIFLFPWAVAFRQLGLFGLVQMIVFVGLVFVAFVYVWQKGGLEWEGVEVRAGAVRAGEPIGLSAELERGPGDRPVGDRVGPGGA